MEQQPHDPHEAAREQELAALNVDTYLQNGRINEALNPTMAMDRMMSEGYSGNQDELHDRLLQVQREAITEVILPETLARMSELSLRRSAEEVQSSLFRTRSNLQQLEDGGNVIRFGLRELEDASPRANYALRALREVAYGSGPLDTEVLQRSVYDLSNFAEMYEQAGRRLRSGATEQEESVRGATISANAGAEAAEEGRRHFVRGKNEAEKQPENAYFDGVEDQVTRRGAASVEEHQESAKQDVETNIGHMADLRDDCADLESKLRTFGSQLAVSRALDGMPRPTVLSDSVYQLKTLAYRAQESGQVPSSHMAELVEEIGRALQQVQQGSESIHAASRRDTSEVEILQEKLAGILRSDAMQKAQ